jgi:hypothetical protein
MDVVEGTMEVALTVPPLAASIGLAECRQCNW